MRQWTSVKDRQTDRQTDTDIVVGLYITSRAKKAEKVNFGVILNNFELLKVIGSDFTKLPV